MGLVVVTVDQRDSRTTPDRIPDAVEALADVPFLRAVERTAGDEFQGVLDSPDALARVVETLLRQGVWNIGIGAGDADDLPPSTRAGRGPVFLAARDAVTAAKSSPWHLRVVGEHPATRPLENTIWLWAAVLARRTSRGWEVADLVTEGLSYDETGRRLGISSSAVSQRAQAAGIVESRRARELVVVLTRCLLGEEPS